MLGLPTLKNKALCIFGAGEFGVRVLNKVNRKNKVLYFVDNFKSGETLEGVPIIDVDTLKSVAFDLVLICSDHWNSINTQLRENGIFNTVVVQNKGAFTDLANAYKKAQRIAKQEDELFLVYQPGKVGSNTLLNYLPKKQTLSLHTFKTTDMFQQWGIKGSANATLNYKVSQLLPYLAKRNLKYRDTSGLKTTIVTGVRDPIGRGVSILMQAMHFLISEHLPRAYVVEEDFPTLFRAMFFQWVNMNYLFEWFDSEFKLVTGIDSILEVPFDQKLGLGTGAIGNTKIVLFRQDKLSPLIESGFNGVLGNPHQYKDSASGISANRSSHKWYSALDAQIKGQFSLPRSYLEQVYSHPFCIHFFDDDTRANLIEKWSD